MPSISKYSGGDSDWISSFVESQARNEARRKVEADYMSSLRSHVEQQKNRGTFVSVEGALSDFSTRLGLTLLEREELAQAVSKQANFFDFEQSKKDVANGAPKSILPGVKPNQQTNKTQINPELAKNTSNDANVNMSSSGQSPTKASNEKTIVTANEELFAHTATPDLFTIHTKDLGDVTFSRSELGIIIEFGSKKSTPFDQSKVVQFVKAKLDALTGFKESQTRLALVKWLDKNEADPVEEAEVTVEEAPVANTVTPSQAPVATPAPTEKPVAQVSPVIEQEETEEEEEEEADFGLDEALKQVAPSAKSFDKSKPAPKLNEKKTISLNGKNNIRLLAGFASTDNSMIGMHSRDKYQKIGVLFDGSADIAKEYEKLDKDTTDIANKIEATSGEKKLFGLIFSTINATKQLASIDKQITSVQRQLESLGKDSPEFADKSNQLAQLAEKKKRCEKAIAKGLNSTAAEFGFAPTIDNLVRQIENNNLEAEVQKRYNQLLKQTSSLDEQHKQLDVSRQAAEYQLEGTRVSQFLSTKRKQLLVSSDKFYDAIDEKVAKARAKLLPRDSTGQPIDPERLTAAQREQWLGLLAEHKLSDDDVKGYKFILNTAPGPSRLDKVGLQQAYKEALDTEKPIVKRASNQVKQGGTEYVLAPFSKKKYQGYLPLDEIIKFQSVVDTGMSEGELLKAHGKDAVDIFLDRRFEAIARAESNDVSKMRQLRTLAKSANDTATVDSKDEAFGKVLALQQEIYESLPVEQRVYFYMPLVAADSIRVPSRFLLPIIYQDILKVKSTAAVKHAEYVDDLRKAMKAKGFATESYDVSLGEYFDQVIDAERTAYVNKINRTISTTQHNVSKLTASKNELLQQLDVLEQQTPTAENRQEIARIHKLIENRDLTISKNQRNNTKATLLLQANEVVGLDAPSIVAGAATAFKITPEVLKEQVIEAASLKGYRFNSNAAINKVICETLEHVFSENDEKLSLILDVFPSKETEVKKDDKSAVALERLRQVGIEGVIAGLPYPIIVVPQTNIPPQVLSIKIGEPYTPAEGVSLPSACNVGKLVIEGKDYIVWSGSLDEVAKQIAALSEKGINLDFDAREEALESLVTHTEQSERITTDLDFTLDEVELSADEFRTIFTTAFNKVVRNPAYVSEAKTAVPKSRSKIRRVPGLIGNPDFSRIGQKKEIYESARQAALDVAKQYGQEAKKDEIAVALTKQKKELNKLEQLRKIVRQYYAGARSYTVEKDFENLFNLKKLSPSMKVVSSLIQEMSDPVKSKENKYTSVEDPTQKINPGMHLLYILRKMIAQKDRTISSLSNFGFNKQEIELVCFRGHGPYLHKVEYSFVAPQTVTHTDVDDDGQQFAANMFDSEELKELATYGLQTYIANQNEGFYKVAGRRPRCPDCQHVFDTYAVHNALKSMVEGTNSGLRKERASSYLAKLNEQDAQTSYATLNDWLDKLDAPSVGKYSRGELGLEQPLGIQSLPLIPLAEKGDAICFAKYLGVFSEGDEAEEADASHVEDAMSRSKTNEKTTPTLRKWQVDLRAVFSKWLYDLVRDFNFPNRSAYINHNTVVKQRVVRKPLGTQLREGVEIVGYTANGGSVVYDSTDEGQIKQWQRIAVKSKDAQGKRIDLTSADFQSRKNLVIKFVTALKASDVATLGSLGDSYSAEQFIQTAMPHESAFIAGPKNELQKAYASVISAVKAGKQIPSDASTTALKALEDYFGELATLDKASSEQSLMADKIETILQKDVTPAAQAVADSAIEAILAKANNSDFKISSTRHPIADIERLRKGEKTVRDAYEHYHTVQQKQMLNNWKWLENSCVRFTADFSTIGAAKKAPKEHEEERASQLSETLRSIQRVRTSTVVNSTNNTEEVSEIQGAFDQFYKALLAAAAPKLQAADVATLGKVRIKLLEQLVHPPVQFGFSKIEADVKAALDNLTEDSEEKRSAVHERVVNEHKHKVAARVLRYIGNVLDTDLLPQSLRSLVKTDTSIGKLFSNVRLALTKIYLDYYTDVHNLASAVGASFSKDKPKIVDPTIFYKVRQVRPTRFEEKYVRNLGKREVPVAEYAKNLSDQAKALAEKRGSAKVLPELSNDKFKVAPAQDKKKTFNEALQDLSEHLRETYLDSAVIGNARNKVVAESNSLAETNIFIKEVDRLITALEKGLDSIVTTITDADAYQDLVDIENSMIEAHRAGDKDSVQQLSAQYREALVGNGSALGGFAGAMIKRLFEAHGGSIAFVLEPMPQPGDRLYIDSAKDGIRKPLRVTQDQLEKRTMPLSPRLASNEFETCDPQVLFALFGAYMQIAEEPRGEASKRSSRLNRRTLLSKIQQDLPIVISH